MTQDGEQLKESEEITSNTLRPSCLAAIKAREQMQRLLSSKWELSPGLGVSQSFCGELKLTRKPGWRPESLATRTKTDLEKRGRSEHYFLLLLFCGGIKHIRLKL